ncbi:MAG: hypothetical protein D6731_04125 [Planctomycetota bacterium]|nr:MAG: hypothetical protein D6731_04125 [Planctomycetota bacterium]
MRALLLLGLLAPLGCASAPAAGGPPPVVRFAVVPAPRVGDEAGEGEELLLEAVTELSLEDSLAFCLVPGPLTATADPAAAEALGGALGSVAAPVIVGPSAAEAARKEFLATLAGCLEGEEGVVTARGPSVDGLTPLRDSAGDLVVRRDAGGRLRIALGETVALRREEGGLVLTLPPLRAPPHTIALVRSEGGRLRVELRSLGDAPAPPGPGSLPWK